MISYRALKKLIGETSLERKCRFLFGIALLFLITASFWWYASRTRRLVENQQLISARMLVSRLLEIQHYSAFLKQADKTETSNSSPGDPAPATPTTEAARPTGKSDWTNPDLARAFADMLNRLPVASARTEWTTYRVGDLPIGDIERTAREQFLDPEGTEDEFWVLREDEEGNRTLHFIAAIRLETGCRNCHTDVEGTVSEANVTKFVQQFTSAADAASVTTTPPPSEAQVMDAEDEEKNKLERRRLPLHSMAAIELPMASVDAQIARNRAVLLATAIVTSFLAMLVAYAIVRYIIVKPVLHLKDVSDEIARGNLNLRADISTGDEFEELSHAFNRMLRHIMTVNDELRTLNESLDGKIDQLAQANMELFNNNRLKDDFLATISHELRTPLNSILGFSDILQSAQNLDDRQRRYVHNIQTSGQSLMVQINDLLDLAKIESGKMEVHAEPIDLAEILDVQVQQVMPLADRKNIDLRIDAPAQPLPLLVQDRGKICQIVTNLLSNAIKFTPEGGRVRVSSRLVDGDSVSFHVEDTGIGIPLQEQEHIFEKFRQGGSAAPGGRDHTKREYEGTGLGLSIVRELSRLLGGDVSLRSEFGKGSLFSVRLPLRVPERMTEPDPPLESRSAPGLPLITSSDLLEVSSEPGIAPAVPLEVHTIGAVPAGKD